MRMRAVDRAAWDADLGTTGRCGKGYATPRRRAERAPVMYMRPLRMHIAPPNDGVGSGGSSSEESVSVSYLRQSGQVAAPMWSSRGADVAAAQSPGADEAAVSPVEAHTNAESSGFFPSQPPATTIFAPYLRAAHSLQPCSGGRTACARRHANGPPYAAKTPRRTDDR